MRLVIAGGGTGGHLYPGIALAEAMRERDEDVKITFMGTDRGLERTVIPQLGYELITFPVGGITGLGLMRGLYRAVSMIGAVLKATGTLKRLAPDLVVGVGGYASVPGVLAAAIRKVPRCIIEQNVIPGKANRFLVRFVPRVYTGFPTSGSVLPPGKTVIAGNPIRKDALSDDRDTGVSREGMTLLILGGSQGAAQLNDLAKEIVPGLLRDFAGLKVIHQTGPVHESQVREHYRMEGVNVETVPFIRNMGAFYSRADLVLSRSGAMSVSELAAAGLPAIFIPYPHAAQNHQRANGRWLEERRGAIILDSDEVTPEILYGALKHLLTDGESLRDMALASKKAGTRDAARRIIEEEMERIGKSGKGDKEESGDQSPESRVQGPESRGQGPESRGQGPESRGKRDDSV